MITKKNYTIQIAGNAVYKLAVGGSYFKILSATGVVRVRCNGVDIDQMIVGQGFEGTDFDSIELLDQSGAPNTVKVVVGSGGFIDATSGVVAVSSLPPVVNPVPRATTHYYYNANAGVVSQQAVAANPVRQAFYIENLDTVNTLYFSFGVPATATVQRLLPGKSWQPSGYCPVGACNVLGSAAVVPYTAIEAV